jgi:hypothetical protein
MVYQDIFILRFRVVHSQLYDCGLNENYAENEVFFDLLLRVEVLLAFKTYFYLSKSL